MSGFAMRLILVMGSLALLGVMMGCDEDRPIDRGLTPDAGGAGGDGVTPDSGGRVAIEDYVVPTSEDELTLLACEVEQQCELGAFSQQIEGSHDATLNGMRCVLEALAEGRTGRYLHRTEWIAGNANYVAKHVMIVRDDRTVSYARTPFGGVGGETWFQPLEEAPDPGQRCTLKPQSFFEECLAAVAAELEGAGPGFVNARQGSRAFACAFGDGDHERTSHLSWFESCETESPIACE
jgi:hypothetical protein